MTAGKSLDKLWTVGELAAKLDVSIARTNSMIRSLRLEPAFRCCNYRLFGPDAYAALAERVQTGRSPYHCPNYELFPEEEPE